MENATCRIIRAGVIAWSLWRNIHHLWGVSHDPKYRSLIFSFACLAQRSYSVLPLQYQEIVRSDLLIDQTQWLRPIMFLFRSWHHKGNWLSFVFIIQHTYISNCRYPNSARVKPSPKHVDRYTCEVQQFQIQIQICFHLAFFQHASQWLNTWQISSSFHFWFVFWHNFWCCRCL